MTERSSRRELMRPVQLLAIAFVCAIFAGGVTLVSGGAFQDGVGPRAIPLAAIVAGITFIVALLGLSLLLLAVDPQDVTKTIDRAVLLDDEPDDAAPDAGVADASDPSAPDAPRA